MKKIFLSAGVILCLTYAIAQPTAGLVAYWPMDGNFNDAGPNGINGTNNGATATTNSGGVTNSAMSFSNPGSTVSQFGSHPVNANLSFGVSQDFSISFSFFVNSPYIHNGGFYDNNLNYSGPGVWFWNSNGFPQIYFNFRNGAVGTSNGAFSLGVWNKICCVRAGTELRIYVNGVVNITGSVGSSTPAYNYPGKFGTMSFASYSPPEYNGCNGKLDEFRIYNRALSQAEITALAVLPVKLGSFTAFKTNENVLLQWQTAYEQNSDHFNVQRSTDGSNFNTIGTMKSKGNSSIVTSYQFIDNTIKNLGVYSIVFYRLESVDIDTRKEISSVVSVKINSDHKELMVLENPVRNDLRIQFTSVAKENANIIITDVRGRRILSKQIELNVGDISTVISVNILTAGTYYVTIRSGQDTQTKPFFKQ